jgi:tetratricopeptide (TPR) repeat protein
MAMTMIERHYDDEALISLIDSNRAEGDTHLPSCKPCSAKIESFRMIADALSDQDVWDTRPVRTEAIPGTIANLRAFADRMTIEDACAEGILPELLAGPREEWLPRLNAHPEWRTAGVARKLLARTYTVVVAMPPDAVEMTSLATNIADGLSVPEYLSDTVARLRGAAWRDKAYALYYVGQFPEAEMAILIAERQFSSCIVNEYDLARLGTVKALVLRPFERYSEASETAVASARVFDRYGDLDKAVSAKLAEAHMLVSRNLYAEAERLLLDLEQQISPSTHIGTHARVLGNLGECYRKMGRVELAIHYYDCASALLDDIGARTETVRVRWSVAVMLAEAGKVADACERLREVTREMEHLGMTSELALAGLDVAEFLLAQSRYEEVDQICHSTMQAFESAGLSYTARALTALAYIREAASQRRSDRTLVRNVRDYIRKLPRQPNLLFAPAPYSLS